MRAGEQGVELAVPVHVAAEPDGHAVGEHLDDAAEAVAVLGGRLDLGHHRLLGGGVEAAHRRLVHLRQVGRAGPGGGLRPGGAHLDDVAHDVDVELGQQRLGQGARSHAGGGLAGRGPLEHVAGVGEAVLLHAGEVGVAGPHLGEGRLGGAVLGPHRHLLLPLVRVAVPLAVADLDGDGRAEGAAVADAADDRDLVLLEPHPRAAPVAEAAAGQLRLHLLRGDGQPGRPSTMTTRARPCDSPAVRNRSMPLTVLGSGLPSLVAGSGGRTGTP